MDPEKTALLEEVIDGLKDKVELLVDAIKENPFILELPALAFLKEWLLSLGATLPTSGASDGASEGSASKGAEPAQDTGVQQETKDVEGEKVDETKQEEEHEQDEDDDSEELKEEDDPDFLPDDPEPFPELGPGKTELSDADQDAQAAAMASASEAFQDGLLDLALEFYTEAIKFGNSSAMMYAKRAETLLKLKQPRACINDSSEALKLNPDSAKGHKVRGRAYRKLRKWREAFADLTTGQKLDYDDDGAEELRLVTKQSKITSDKQNREKWKQELKGEDDPERLPKDPKPFPDFGPGEKELSQDDLDGQGYAMEAAGDALQAGMLEDALNLYTEAIKFGNSSAMMYAKRAETLLKLKRPCACINDSSEALRLNPNSAKACKVRGKAYRKLCKWQEAFADLTTGQNLDYDDDTADVLQFVSKKWKIISDLQNHKRLKQEERSRKRKEREYEEKVAEAKRRKDQALKEYEEQKRQEEEEQKERDGAEKKRHGEADQKAKEEVGPKSGSTATTQGTGTGKRKKCKY